MGPIALASWAAGNRSLVDAVHYRISSRVHDVAYKMAMPYWRAGMWAMPDELPAEMIVLEFDKAALVVEETEKSIDMYQLSRGLRVRPLIYWLKTRATFVALDGVDDDLAAHAGMLASAVLHLIDQPRLIELRAPSRQQRRYAAQIVGSEVVARWREAHFTCGASRTAQKGQERGSWRSPLTFAIAHWRRAQEGWPTARLRPDQPGWWSRIPASWKGHPDFGISPKVMVPRLPEDDASDAPIIEQPNVRAVAAVAAGRRAVAAWQRQNLERHGRIPHFDKAIIAG